jgi:N-acetylglucosaminyl-diphospho-decaprenol L-rhamnosyltransferase
MDPLVSAIVLNYRMPQDTVRCVRALLKQTMIERMEILIVDNHSKNDSIGVIRNTFETTPHVRMLETNRNIGYGKGNTTAINQAHGTYLLIINPDNELEAQGLRKMIDAMEQDVNIGILGPKLIHEDGTVRDSYRTFPTLTDVFIKRTFLKKFFQRRMHRYLQHGEDHTKMRDVDWLAGACLLMRHDLFEQLDGFDPRFFLFFEDTDLCRRCWNMGKRVVYFPFVHATDRKHRLSEGGFWSLFTKKTVRIHLFSALKYFSKWQGQPPSRANQSFSSANNR